MKSKIWLRKQQATINVLFSLKQTLDPRHVISLLFSSNTNYVVVLIVENALDLIVFVQQKLKARVI